MTNPLFYVKIATRRTHVRIVIELGVVLVYQVILANRMIAPTSYVVTVNWLNGARRDDAVNATGRPNLLPQILYVQ